MCLLDMRSCFLLIYKVSHKMFQIMLVFSYSVLSYQRKLSLIDLQQLLFLIAQSLQLNYWFDQGISI